MKYRTKNLGGGGTAGGHALSRRAGDGTAALWQDDAAAPSVPRLPARAAGRPGCRGAGAGRPALRSWTASRCPVILDEIQNAPELFAYVRSRIDRHPERKGQWLLTGSQEAPLMKGVTESMAGRAAVFTLLPYSAEEAPGMTLRLGGFPEVQAAPEVADIWFRSYVQTYLERDVRAVASIRDLATFRRFHGTARQPFDKVWRQGVGTRCKRGAPTLNLHLNPHLNSLLIGTLTPPAYSLACGNDGTNGTNGTKV
jgi:hypothetical protein